MTTADFIRNHREDDVRQLALRADKYPDVDMPYALSQISGWQAASKKLPSWAAVDGIVYPPHISLEQCSGEHAARYKAGIVRRLLKNGDFIDITGGFGVDFSFMSRYSGHAVYVERQQHLCRAVAGNLPLLGVENADIICGDGVEYLHNLEEKAGVIYVDPARRDQKGARTYAISDCAPDVLALEEELLGKSRHVIVKLSPMLDWHEAVRQMNNVCGNAVKEVHIVSTRNECKELLLVLQKDCTSPLVVHCVNDETVFFYTYGQPQAETVFAGDAVSGCLYEPNASIMKAGCFGHLCQRYNVSSLGANSHLFVSPDEIADFPGRAFRIAAVSSMNKKSLAAALGGISKANITVRNFPMPAAELRKKLKLADGGDTYIFATTLGGNSRVLIVATKL